MKKLVIAMGLLAAVSIAHAGCFGNFCSDDTGSSINGVIADGNGIGLPSLTVAQMNAATPKAKGQLIFITNPSSSGENGVCVSSGTGTGAYITIAASSGAVHCQ